MSAVLPNQWPGSDDIKLGDRVRDSLTGFAGVVIGWSVFVYCSPRAEVQAESCENGKPRESVWFDAARLERCNGEKAVGYFADRLTAKVSA